MTEFFMALLVLPFAIVSAWILSVMFAVTLKFWFKEAWQSIRSIWADDLE